MEASGEKEQINLILAGGGVRFPAYVGALAAFEEMGVEIVSVAGASAGSIVGSFLAAGYPVTTLRRLALETDFTAFKDFSLRGLLLEGGVFLGNRFERWMDQQLQGARFRDMPRNLFITAVDLIAREAFFFSKQTTPDVLVSKAVRCSMSIPGVWRPQHWEERLLVDGQLMPWLPTGIQLMETAHGGPPIRTVMLRMVSTDARHLPKKKHLYPWDFAKIVLDTMLNALENQRVPGGLWQDTILIQVEGVHTLQLGLSVADKDRLYQMGYDQAKRYFRKKSSESGA